MAELQEASIALLRKLISIPSFSGQEDGTARVIAAFLKERGLQIQQKMNNIWVRNLHYDTQKPTILLNSHHDTVRPNAGYTRDPFSPQLEARKLYGLGSNDAGASLVSLLSAFLYFFERPDLKYNLVFAATAEEENSGKNGVESILDELGPLEFAIVGEPTCMDAAIAEKGLMVLDCLAKGRSGHAAREEGINAIYQALPDLTWFQSYSFPKVSPTLGPVKMTVSVISAGSQHNVVPDECHFVVDVRVTDAYTHAEVLEIIRSHVTCVVTPRSTRLNPSSIPEDHPFIQAAVKLGAKTYGSPTTSDQALLPVPSVKMGPGDSARSHTADEFVYIDEITDGIGRYINALEEIL